MHKLLPFAALTLCCTVGGCVSVSVTGTGQSSGQMKQQISESLFYKSTKFFYPSDTTDNPRQIVHMTPRDLEGIESEFAAKLRQVLGLHSAHRETIAKLFGEASAAKPTASVLLVNHNLAEAQTQRDGEITIDVRVLHAMLQSALLVAFSVEIDVQRVRAGKKLFSPAGYSLEEEKFVIDYVLAKRARLDKTKGRTLLGDLMHANPREREKPTGELDWFEMSKLSNEFNRAAVRYEAQVLYLLAHEVGHIVLGHFSEHPVVLPATKDEPLDECGVRRSLERAADVYAATLITLATVQQATADIIPFEAAGSVPVFEGFDTFFKYAYGYAGFAAAGSTTACKYPPPAERLALVQAMYKSIRGAQIDAIFEKAKREQ